MDTLKTLEFENSSLTRTVWVPAWYSESTLESAKFVRREICMWGKVVIMA